MITALRVALASCLLLLAPTIADAALADSGVGSVSAVRTYQIGPTGLRAQITVTGASHNCGVGPATFYFDSDKLGVETVKAILAVSLSAQMADRPVIITFDCSLGAGGYGWGYAMQVQN